MPGLRRGRFPARMQLAPKYYSYSHKERWHMNADHTQQPYSAGGYDWLAVWRRLYDEEREQGESATAPGFATGGDFWAGQADRFAAAAGRSDQPDAFMRFLLPRLRPEDRVLDIGAGTGRYEPLLAEHVAHVYALEPSPSMRRHLEQRSAANVEVLSGSWPEANAPACDVAISAHVLYGVREIGPFLRRMHTVAQRACYLFLTFRHPASFISPFWERFHGQPRLPLPGALECLNALYQLGIPAHLALVPLVSRLSFADEDAALADIRWRLRFPPNAERDTRLLSAIRELLDRDADGHLRPRDLPAQAAVIWWERT